MAGLLKTGLRMLDRFQRLVTPTLNQNFKDIEAAFGVADARIEEVKAVADSAASKTELDSVAGTVPTAAQIEAQIDAQVEEITNRVGSLESWQEEGVEATKILGKIKASQVQIKVLDELGGLVGESVDWANLAPGVTSRVTEIENENELLAQKIETIVAVSSGDLGKVLAAVQLEQTARKDADSAEALSRTQLAAEVAGNKSSADQSIAALNTAAQAEAQARLALASTMAQNEATATERFNTLSTNVQAVGQSVTTLGAKVDGNKATYDATVQALSEKDQSLTTQLNTISATVTTNKTTTDAAIANANQARADADAANAATIATVAARMNTGGDIATAITAAATAASRAQTTADGKASAASVADLSATIKEEIAATNTRVSTVETSVAGKASASEVAVIRAKVDKNETSITSISAVAIDAQNKVNAKYGAILDVNGKLSGFQCANNGTISDFVITSDKVLINADEMIVDGSLTAKKFNAAELKAAIGSFGSLSALSATLGYVTAGCVRSSDRTRYLDLTGEQDYFLCSDLCSIGHDGNLSATNAWISGTIYASHLRNSANTNYVNLQLGSSDAGRAIQLGGGAFYVTASGFLYAQNAYIQGEVIASKVRNAASDTVLDMSGSDVLLKVAGVNRVWKTGKSRWANVIWSGNVPVSMTLFELGEDGPPTASSTWTQSAFVDTGISADTVAALIGTGANVYDSFISVQAWGARFVNVGLNGAENFGFSWNPAFKLWFEITPVWPVPVTAVQNWGNVTLHLRINAIMQGATNPNLTKVVANAVSVNISALT